MSNRYPTEDELKRILEWPFDDLDGLMDFIEPIIDYYGAVRKIDGRYHVITGGWSGNEDVVGALLNNMWVRSSCYQSWERGGKFVFAQDIENTEVDDMLERIAALEAERNNLSLGLDKANGRILALEQIESNLTKQRDEARGIVREMALSAPNDWAKYFIDSWDDKHDH